MKKNYLNIIPLIAFTLVGCTGTGGRYDDHLLKYNLKDIQFTVKDKSEVTLNDKAGNKITFKRENLSCLEGEEFESRNEGIKISATELKRCTAKGLVQDLDGSIKRTRRYKASCYVGTGRDDEVLLTWEEINLRNESTSELLCRVVEKFGL